MKATGTFGWCCRWPWVLVALAIALGLIVACAGSHYFLRRPNQAAVLNGLRDEINENYGFNTDGTPRVNCGPCARFAIAFRERWNARFREKVNIACVMSPDGSECGHVALKFLDGGYFDGGYGVMSEETLLRMFPNCSIEEMVEFDRNRLSELVGGLDHVYPLCPNYSDKLTAKLIESSLARLAAYLEVSNGDNT